MQERIETVGDDANLQAVYDTEHAFSGWTARPSGKLRSSTASVILYGDQGQQHEQHCSENTTNDAFAGMLCGIRQKQTF